MPELVGYTVEKLLYEGPETRVRRARPRSAGDLGKLAAVPGVVRARELSHLQSLEDTLAYIWPEQTGAFARAGAVQVFAELCGKALPSAARLAGRPTAGQPAVVQADVTRVAWRRLSAPAEVV